MLLPTLSLKQPWAYALVYLGKPYENREWKTTNPNRKFRGTFLIHASLSWTKADQESYEDMRWICERPGVCDRATLKQVPAFSALPRGGIVGIAEVIGAVTDSIMHTRAQEPSRHWYFGPFALEIANAKPLPFTPCKGMLGFFNTDTTVLGLDQAIMAATKNHITPAQRVLA